MAKRNREGQTAGEFNEIAKKSSDRHGKDLVAMKKVSDDAGRDLEERKSYRRKRVGDMQRNRTA